MNNQKTISPVSKPIPSEEVIQAQARTLYLSRVDANFDWRRDIALDPWCFVGQEDVYPEWQSLNFIDPLPTLDEIKREQDKVHLFLNHLVLQLARELNAHLTKKYSADFWRILLMPWLAELTQRAWRGYLLIEKTIASTGSDPVTVNVWGQPVSWSFKTIDQFMECLLHDRDFNWWIDSQLISALAPANWNLVSAIDTPDPDALILKYLPSQKSSLPRRTIRTIKRVLGYTDIAGTKWGGVLLSIFANILPMNRSRHVMQPDQRFDPKQAFPETFLKVFDRILDATMPRAYREDFQQYITKASRIPYRAGRLRIGTVSFWNEDEKFISALAKEAGEKLLQTQHGGTYGISDAHIKTQEVEYRNDAFITWGWTEHGDYTGRFIALPSPLLSRIADRHKEIRPDLIVVGIAPRFRLPRIGTKPYGKDFLQFCSQTLEFLDALGDDLRKKTRYRGSMNVKGDIDVKKNLCDQFPDLRFLENDFHGEIMGCRLIVMQYPGTTLNMSMAANIPTICLWNRDYFPRSRQAEIHFEELRKNRMLFFDEQEAAKHIRDVWDDVDGWWQSEPTQRARRNWNFHYARTSRVWWWHWMKVFVQLSREK